MGYAGKSTYAKKLYKELKEKDPDKKIVICSVDEQRLSSAVPLETGKENFIKKIKASINLYDIIILDFSFDHVDSRKWLLDSVKFDYNINFYCIYLKPSIEQIVNNYFDKSPKIALTKEKYDEMVKVHSNKDLPVEKEFNF